MNEAAEVTRRVVVMARPTLGRAVEAMLNGAGYEVHRTPGDDDLVGLVARVRPHAVIVSLDIPWLDALESVRPLVERARPIPLLLLGEAGDIALSHAVLQLSLPLDGKDLLARVHQLVTAHPEGSY